MNNSSISRFFQCFFILLLTNTIFCQVKIGLESLNYYDLIGLNGAQLAKEALNAVNKDQAYIDAKKAWDQAIKDGDATTIKATANKKEQIRERVTNKFYAEKIKAACIQVRKSYQKQLEKAQKDAEEAEEFERQQKSQAVVELQKKLLLTTTACPLLLDPKKRRAYDAQLIKPTEEGDTYFQGIQRGIEDAMSLAPSRRVLLNQILGDILSQIEIPGPALKIFNQDLDVRSLSLLPRPMGPEVRYGIGFTGLMALNRFEVRLSIYIVQDIYGSRKFSFIVDLPTTYKISDLFPTFNGFDAFTFPQAKLIIANFEGADQEGFPFKKGFNFGAMLDLSGPLKVLSELKDKASSLKSLVFESQPIIMSGVIPLDISQAEFTAQVPLHIGVDLQKIAAMPTAISKVINKITSDDFTLTISPVKPKKAIGEENGKRFSEPVKPYIEILKTETETHVDIKKDAAGEEEFVFKKVPRVTTVATIPFGYKIAAETGLRITLGTQPTPIRLNVHGVVIPISKDHPQGLLTVGGSMKGMLELGWLGSIGDAILEFDFDGATMGAAALVGLPFTGMHIGGKLGLGKAGETRALLSAAGGFAISASAAPIDFMIELSGENIQFGTLVNYAMEKAAQAKLLKSPIPADRIPIMTLHRVWGYGALKDTTIAGKLYRAGIGLQAEAQLFDYQAGFRIFMDNKFKLSGWGYMPPINFKVKGTEVFRLYGLEPNKGPRVAFSFDPQEPLKGMFGLQSTVHLPALGLKQLADFTWQGYVLNADFETEFPAGFSVVFGIRMNIKEGTEMLSPYDQAKQDIEQLIAGADRESTNVQAAQKLIDQADKLYRDKRPREAMSRLTQARALVANLTPTTKTKGSVQIAPGAETIQTKATEGEMEAIKEDVFALFKRAGDMYKQDDTRYKLARELLQRAAREYQQYRSSETQRQLDALYNKTLQAAGNDAAAVAQAQEAVMAEKTRRVKSIIDKLVKARQWLRMALEETGETPGDYLSKKQEIETDPGAKWSKLYVKFGFKGDFAKFLNAQAVTTLRRVKENSIKKLDQLTERVAALQAQAVGSVETEINRVKETITAKEKEIGELQTSCRALPLYKQPKCRAVIAAQQAILTSRKAYLNALLRPGKAVVRGVTSAAGSVVKQLAQSKALRAATEAILEGAASGLEMIATGINFFNIIEARGEYSWEDMQSLKLPRLVRLVANIEIIPGSPIQIVLSDLQFDFKHPAQSAAEISRSLITNFIEQQQNKYLKYAELLVSE